MMKWKIQVLRKLAEIFEQRYPGFKAAIETVDVVTPMTCVRYTGLFKGTCMTWILLGENIKKFRVEM